MRIIVILPFFTVCVSGSVTKTFATVDIFCPKRSFPEYAEFNSKVSEYFFTNFGNAGIAYLEYVLSNGSSGRCIDRNSLGQCGEETSKNIFDEMNRIVAGYNYFRIRPSLWSWDPKKINRARYSIHRFIGLIESIAHTKNVGHGLVQIKCPNTEYKVNFLEAFGDNNKRRNLSQSLEVFKQSISQLQTIPDKMVINALIVIGRDVQGLGLVKSVFRQYNELCEDSSIRICMSLQDLLERTAARVGEITIKDSIDRVFDLFTQDSLKQSRYTQLMGLRESAARSTSSCTDNTLFVRVIDDAISKILELFFRETQYSNLIGVAGSLQCGSVLPNTLYALVERFLCVQSKCKETHCARGICDEKAAACECTGFAAIADKLHEITLLKKSN